MKRKLKNNNKIIKVKAKYKNELGDISDYLQAQKDYRNGNYLYQTIRKKEDIETAHQKGKKFVFTAGDKSFIVLDPKGFVISSMWGVLRAYSWQNIDLKIYQVQRVMRMGPWGVFRFEEPFPRVHIYVTLPKGGILKIKSERYDLREFPEGFASNILNEIMPYQLLLFGLTFQYFFELGKYGKSKLELKIKTPEEKKKERLIKIEKTKRAEEIICNFLMRNKGKAFTANSLNNRCLELQQLELELEDLEAISKKLYFLQKIAMEVKDNKIYYYSE